LARTAAWHKRNHRILVPDLATAGAEVGGRGGEPAQSTACRLDTMFLVVSLRAAGGGGAAFFSTFPTL